MVALDPAAGTGTYPLTAIQHGLDLATARYGKGTEASSAGKMARNIHAFELLVGPYAVAHLRVAERVMDAGGSLPEDGVRVYLTDTLESPHTAPPGRFPLVAREHPGAGLLREPPYDRQQIEPGDEGVERKGGWVRNGDSENERPLLEDFLQPARDAGAGVHLKDRAWAQTNPERERLLLSAELSQDPLVLRGVRDEDLSSVGQDGRHACELVSLEG